MDLTDLVQGHLSEAEHLTLGALITMDVHARDVLQELVDAGAGCTGIAQALLGCWGLLGRICPYSLQSMLRSPSLATL
jgi:hypothetical protein